MKKDYKHRVYDINSDSYIYFDSYSTKEFIERIEGAKVLNETEMSVDDVSIDGDGRYIDKTQNI